MPELLIASNKEKLWHKMRRDLLGFVPEIAGNRLLMCCACGRFLPYDCFDVEHLIPRQALRHDPANVRVNPATPANIRSGNLLLCRMRLRIKGNTIYGNGCNSWKGRFYDHHIAEMTRAFDRTTPTDTHIIAALSLAYLAMVAEFGYVVALMRSGLLIREQFFRPYSFHRDLPLRSQILFGGRMPDVGDHQMWNKPFGFGFDRPGACTVVARNFVVMVPISHDPRQPIVKHLKIVPSKYKLRPNFGTVFD